MPDVRPRGTADARWIVGRLLSLRCLPHLVVDRQAPPAAASHPHCDSQAGQTQAAHVASERSIWRQPAKHLRSAARQSGGRPSPNTSSLEAQPRRKRWKRSSTPSTLRAWPAWSGATTTSWERPSRTSEQLVPAPALKSKRRR